MSDTSKSTKANPGEERFVATGKSVTVIKKPQQPQPKKKKG